ncbi:hypothetical protein TREES_T100002610 [Tupaia chinensis]|uniref:Uncharacterized protein n=1 Tax=Tupaia chinensis TaxID=246437 RepID=L9L6U5_TUPCH|nr:hypothetical protein TREES_T100002610 [Tupaia chinensis]
MGKRERRTWAHEHFLFAGCHFQALTCIRPHSRVWGLRGLSGPTDETVALPAPGSTGPCPGPPGPSAGSLAFLRAGSHPAPQAPAGPPPFPRRTALLRSQAPARWDTAAAPRPLHGSRAPSLHPQPRVSANPSGSERTVLGSWIVPNSWPGRGVPRLSPYSAALGKGRNDSLSKRASLSPSSPSRPAESPTGEGVQLSVPQRRCEQRQPTVPVVAVGAPYPLFTVIVIICHTYSPDGDIRAAENF